MIRTTVTVYFAHCEPTHRLPLPKVCPRKPNFIDGWTLDTTPDGDHPGEVFEFFERHTSDGLVYVVDIE